MPFLEAVRLALMQIRVQKLKSFFTLIGVTLGVTFLIGVVSIVQGMSNYIEEDFAGRLLGANTFTLRRFAWFGNNTTADEWLEWQRRPEIIRDDVDFVESILPSGTRWAIENQSGTFASSKFIGRPRRVTTYAVEGDYFTIKKYELSGGRAIAQQEFEFGAPVIVIGDEVGQYFFPNLDPIGRELLIANIPYRVIGVLKHQGNLFGMSLDELVIGPYNSPLRRLTYPRTAINSLIVQASDPLMLEDAMESVREGLRGRRHLRPGQRDNFAMETSETALAFLGKLRTTMTIAGTALPGIGLIVGGLVIMNIMLVAVAERTHEIGIRKSVGATRGDIHRQFLIEATTLSTLGAIIGIGLGIGGAYLIAWKTPLPAAVAPWSIVAATALGMVVGIVAGVYPARRASQLDPIDALGRE
jgi:putative ABC transport system permease protein